MALRGIQLCIIQLLCRWGGQDHTGGIGYLYMSEYTEGVLGFGAILLIYFQAAGVFEITVR